MNPMTSPFMLMLPLYRSLQINCASARGVFLSEISRYTQHTAIPPPLRCLLSCSSTSLANMKLRILITYLAPLILMPRSLALSLPINTTVPLSLGNTVMCMTSDDPSSRPTTIDGCRPNLNWIRTLPNYRRIQDFQENWGPKLRFTGGLEKPPFTWHVLGSDCAVQVASGNPAVIDHFSFEQVRTLATDIIEECKLGGGKGWGHGGIAPIGRGLGWTVAVSGFVL